MAYGITASSITNNVTNFPSRMAAPLPASGITATLHYPGKLSENDIKTSVKSFYVNPNLGIDLHIAPVENSIVWADNWFALHSIISTGKKAKLIYLDPPYATGMEFQSREQKYAYSDNLLSAAYIENIRRRLILMREILAEDGSIYVHIGYQMVGEIKLLLDEIFGVKNFRNIITRRKCSSKNFTKNQYSNLNDYLLFYSKSQYYIWNKPGTTPDPEWIAKEYPKLDERGQYKLVPIHAPGIRKGQTGLPWKNLMPPPGKHWQFVPAKLDAFDKAGEIHWSKNGNPRRKVYLTAEKSISYSDYWENFRDAHHQSILITGYPTEKNFEMLKMIIAASSNEGDLVIDPYSGSGSTIDAARNLGRKWIGIDESALAIETSINRMKSGRSPMGDYIGKNQKIEVDLFQNIEKEDFSVYMDIENVKNFPNEANKIIEINS